jgi:cation:H+ antiporter
LIKGSAYFVDGALSLSLKLNMAPITIGLSVVAFGTSSPELFTTVVAAGKGYHDIAIDNAIGSSIFNILFILPITAIITLFPFLPELNLDIFVMFITSFLLFVTMFSGKKKTLDRREEIGFIIIYLVYLTYLIFN